MKLDRNLNGDGRGKYGLVNTRKYLEFLRAVEQGGEPAAVEGAATVSMAMCVLEEAGVIEWGKAGTEEEFFVIKLKDRFSRPALESYAQAAANFPGADAGLLEYAGDVTQLAARAGKNHPACKTPD